MLSIVVPVYNEGKSIASFLAAVRENVAPPYEILVAYDFDGDDTVPVVNKILEAPAASGRTIRLVKNNVSRGPSGAIREGFRQAAGEEILVTMADLSDDLSQVAAMREFVRVGYDMACPSRYCKGGRQDLNSVRAWLPRWVGWTLFALAGFPTHDPTNSFRLYTRRVLTAFPIASTHSFSLTLEIAAKAHALGFKMKEIPTVWNVRTVGESKFPFVASLVSYLPWFFLALTNNRLFRLPLRLRERLAGAA